MRKVEAALRGLRDRGGVGRAKTGGGHGVSTPGIKGLSEVWRQLLRQGVQLGFQPASQIMMISLADYITLDKECTQAMREKEHQTDTQAQAQTQTQAKTLTQDKHRSDVRRDASGKGGGGVCNPKQLDVQAKGVEGVSPYPPQNSRATGR